MMFLVSQELFDPPGWSQDVLASCSRSFCRTICEFGRVQLVALLELSVPFGISHPLSSCIPLSRCKPLVVCCGGRLRATVFGKIAILSLERVSNCTNIPYFNEVSRFFVWSNPRLCQVAWSLLHTIIIFNRVNYSEEHRLSSSFLDSVLPESIHF